MSKVVNHKGFLIQKKMNRIWWFGKIDMLCNELVPDDELVNTILSTIQHDIKYGDHKFSSVVGTTIPSYEDLLYIIQNMCRLTTSQITNDVTTCTTHSITLFRYVQYSYTCCRIRSDHCPH